MPTENLAQASLSATALSSALAVIPRDIVNVDDISINGYTVQRQIRVAFAKAAEYDKGQEEASRLREEIDRLGTALQETLDAMDPSQLHPDGDTEHDQLRRAYNIVFEGLGLHEQPQEPEMTWAEYQAEHGPGEE